MINWENYNPMQQFVIIEDIVGLCLMFEKNNSAIGKFKLDTGGGGFVYSLFVTWKRADPFNKKLLIDVLKKIIDKYEIDKKTDELKKTYRSAAKYSNDYLSEHGVNLDIDQR